MSNPLKVSGEYHKTTIYFLKRIRDRGNVRVVFDKLTGVAISILGDDAVEYVGIIAAHPVSHYPFGHIFNRFSEVRLPIECFNSLVARGRIC